MALIKPHTWGITIAPYHVSEDNSIPCTNACGKEVLWSTGPDWWVHDDGVVACEVDPYEGQEACPEMPNDEVSEWTKPMQEAWPVLYRNRRLS